MVHNWPKSCRHHLARLVLMKQGMTGEPNKDLFLRQLFDAATSTYTYLVADLGTREAMLIDPVLECVERDLGLLSELGFTLRYAADTHVHADHVTASGVLRERTGCTTVGARAGADCADLKAAPGSTLEVGRLRVEVLGTPGHTDDSLSYRVGANVFTGDALLIRGTGRTDFQNGDASQLYDSITGTLFALPDNTKVWPGHDYKGRTVSTIGEEKRFNPRLAGKSREQFVDIMENLDLPPPARIVEAVAANRTCGLPPRADGSVPAPEPSVQPPPPSLSDIWSTAHGTSAGYREVGPRQATATRGVRVVDVREPEEFDGPLGHLPDAECVPLASLSAAADTWKRDEPVLLVCRSGRRSGQAAKTLIEMGFPWVLNLRGGMMAVNDLTARTGS